MVRALDNLHGLSYLRRYYVDMVIEYYDSRKQIAELAADH